MAEFLFPGTKSSVLCVVGRFETYGDNIETTVLYGCYNQTDNSELLTRNVKQYFQCYSKEKIVYHIFLIISAKQLFLRIPKAMQVVYMHHTPSPTYLSLSAISDMRPRLPPAHLGFTAHC